MSYEGEGIDEEAIEEAIEYTNIADTKGDKITIEIDKLLLPEIINMVSEREKLFRELSKEVYSRNLYHTTEFSAMQSKSSLLDEFHEQLRETQKELEDND